MSHSPVGSCDSPARNQRTRLLPQVGMRLPDVAPRPLAWCETCDEKVNAVQTWRRGHRDTRIGKYKQAYDYTCPNHDRDVVVEPYTRPAADIINWSDLGTRIGDRMKPLVPGTMARIQAGLNQFPADPSLVTLNHSGHDGRAFRPDRVPIPSRTVKIGEGLVIPSGAFAKATATTDLAAPRRRGRPRAVHVLLHPGLRDLGRPGRRTTPRSPRSRAGLSSPGPEPRR